MSREEAATLDESSHDTLGPIVAQVFDVPVHEDLVPHANVHVTVDSDTTTAPSNPLPGYVVVDNGIATADQQALAVLSCEHASAMDYIKQLETDLNSSRMKNLQLENQNATGTDSWQIVARLSYQSPDLKL